MMYFYYNQLVPNLETTPFMQVARIILFMYLFYHMFVHYDQVHHGSFEVTIHHSYRTHNSDLYLFIDDRLRR